MTPQPQNSSSLGGVLRSSQEFTLPRPQALPLSAVGGGTATTGTTGLLGPNPTPQVEVERERERKRVMTRPANDQLINKNTEQEQKGQRSGKWKGPGNLPPAMESRNEWWLLEESEPLRKYITEDKEVKGYPQDAGNFTTRNWTRSRGQKELQFKLGRRSKGANYHTGSQLFSPAVLATTATRTPFIGLLCSRIPSLLACFTHAFT